MNRKRYLRSLNFPVLPVMWLSTDFLLSLIENRRIVNIARVWEREVFGVGIPSAADVDSIVHFLFVVTHGRCALNINFVVAHFVRKVFFGLVSLWSLRLIALESLRIEFHIVITTTSSTRFRKIIDGFLNSFRWIALYYLFRLFRILFSLLGRVLLWRVSFKIVRWYGLLIESLQALILTMVHRPVC